MKYNEMVQIFYENGIDINKYARSYGLKPVRIGEGFIVNLEKDIYKHITIGDRDNGRIDKEYDSEDDMVEDMVCNIRRYALDIRRKCKRKKQEESELNKKIYNIAHYCVIQITGYKGFSIIKESDRDTWQENWKAVQILPKGKGVEFYSFSWSGDAKDAKEQEQEAMELLKAQIDIFVILNNVDLKKHNIYIGEKSNVPYSVGCYEEAGAWYLYEVGERQDFTIVKEGKKEEIIKHLYYKIRGRIS